MSKKNELRLMVYSVLAVLVVMTVIIRPVHFSYPGYSEWSLFKEAKRLTYQVSETMRAGGSKEEASWLLKSPDAKSLVRKFNITVVSQRKVKIENRGWIGREYLPTYHVMVFFHYQFKNTSHLRFVRFVDNYRLYEVHEMELLRMIRSAGYGTVEILLGGIDSLEEVPDRDRYDEVVLGMYLVVKHLAYDDKRFLEECVELASQTFRNYDKGRMVRLWIDKLLKKALTSPRLPETLDADEPESYSKGLRDWYLQNKESITFSNSFLFGDNADH